MSNDFSMVFISFKISFIAAHRSNSFLNFLIYSWKIFFEVFSYNFKESMSVFISSMSRSFSSAKVFSRSVNVLINRSLTTIAFLKFSLIFVFSMTRPTSRSIINSRESFTYKKDMMFTARIPPTDIRIRAINKITLLIILPLRNCAMRFIWASFSGNLWINVKYSSLKLRRSVAVFRCFYQLRAD